MSRPQGSKSPLLATIKDIVLFTGGVVGMIFEALPGTEPRPILVGAYLLAVGLPIFWGVDRVYQRIGGGPAPAPTDPPADQGSESQP